MEQLAIKSGAMGPDSRARGGGGHTTEDVEVGGLDPLLGALHHSGADIAVGGGDGGGKDGTVGSAGGAGTGGVGLEASLSDVEGWGDARYIFCAE